jgi:hypothetical protein
LIDDCGELLGGWDQIDLEGSISILPRQFIALFNASGEAFRLQSRHFI